MDTYYGIIFFKNGTSKVVITSNGLGAEQICERTCARELERYRNHAVSDFFMPTRYEVRKK